MRVMRAGLVLAATCMALAACSRGDGSGQATASGDGAGPAAGAASGMGADRAYAGERGGGYGAREDRGPTPMFHGEPMWSENRAHSAKENAEYHFEQAGGDLGAKTLDDFLTKVHRFGDHPPPGTLKLVRANGDRLLYDPKANLFAVFTRQGAPRTVFKPNDGMSYWTEQKTREQARASGGGYGGGYGGSRYGRGGGSGDQGE